MGREVRQLPRYPRRHRPGAINERWAEYGWLYLDGRIKLIGSAAAIAAPAWQPARSKAAVLQDQCCPSPAWLPAEDMRLSVRPVPCA
jgi:hypothetical protein